MRKFMRTRQAPAPVAQPAPVGPPAHRNGRPPHLHKTNGQANGVGPGVRREDQHSTVSSRYWNGSGASGESRDSGGGGGPRVEPPWEDTEFPTSWHSVGDKRLAADLLWLRPHELCTRPQFRGADAGGGAGAEEETPEDFAARWSVEVGELGDPHLCATAAALALTPRLLARVLPVQSFRQNYNGVFRFKFWVFGTWREVAVDDRLPTRRGRVLASHCGLPDDFTLPLLEKAYAKLYGSYVALRGGSRARALQDLTGGIVQSFCLPAQPRPLTFQVLNSAVPRSTLVVATVITDKEPGWRRLRTGLISGQAYCVTGLARVRPAGGGEPGTGADGALVRLRAASGRGEWAGAWARGSLEWRALPDHDRDLLALRAAHPAEFWMSFSDFARSFTQLELVHVGPDDWMAEPALHGRRPWRAVLARRRWRTGYNAGGPPHCIETTGMNPQFHVQIPRCEGAGGAGARKCHVVVSVTQQYVVREGKRPRGPSLRAIGFAVYELPAGVVSGAGRRTALAALSPLDVTHESRAREVVTFFTLPAGEYLVVPHTRRPNTDAAFLLRILTDQQTNIWEVNEDNMVLRNISSEFVEERHLLPADIQTTVFKMLGKQEIEELDARQLRTALRRVWRWCLAARPSLELCRALVTLRDQAISGRMPARELPALLTVLALWRHAYLKHAGRCGACSSYRLRALLWAAGVTASNKVLECLVVRFARRDTLTPEAYVMALARLHLAHERYRSLDTKMKSNPLSLEEMILMTIYS